VRVSFVVDGERVDADPEPRLLLAEWLRQTGRTGVHIGCDTSSCGACTVLVDDLPVKSCTMFTVQAAGRRVTTVHGLTPAAGLSPIQQAFSDEHGLQCGFCTPGFVVAVEALLRANADPGREEIVEALDGNLCRCTGYVSIVRAVQRAARLRRGESASVVAGAGHETPLAVNTVRESAVHENLSETEVV
jgi:aerobic carbon-monoxide dehydrogenase small subunit